MLRPHRPRSTRPHLAHRRRLSRRQPSFVLPGESLSRYGGAPSDDAPKSAAPPPARPASSFKPSTLIDSPLEWDGSGLLPGESLSKHRNRQPEPALEVAPEPFGVFSDAVQDSEPQSGQAAAAGTVDAVEEEEFVEEFTESASEFSQRHVSEETQEEDAQDAAEPYVAEELHAVQYPTDQDDFEETIELAPASFASEPHRAEPDPIEVVPVEPQNQMTMRSRP